MPCAKVGRVADSDVEIPEADFAVPAKLKGLGWP